MVLIKSNKLITTRCTVVIDYQQTTLQLSIQSLLSTHPNHFILTLLRHKLQRTSILQLHRIREHNRKSSALLGPMQPFLRIRNLPLILILHPHFGQIPNRLLPIIIHQADLHERHVPNRTLLLIRKRKQHVPEPPLRQRPHLQSPEPTRLIHARNAHFFSEILNSARIRSACFICAFRQQNRTSSNALSSRQRRSFTTPNSSFWKLSSFTCSAIVLFQKSSSFRTDRTAVISDWICFTYATRCSKSQPCRNARRSRCSQRTSILPVTCLRQSNRPSARSRLSTSSPRISRYSSKISPISGNPVISDAKRSLGIAPFFHLYITFQVRKVHRSQICSAAKSIKSASCASLASFSAVASCSMIKYSGTRSCTRRSIARNRHASSLRFACCAAHAI